MGKVVAYLRTSSAANVGTDKDSAERQRLAIATYATQTGHQIAGEFYDAAVQGKDPIGSRPGFTALLLFCAENNIDTIVVESASRFARDLVMQEMGFASLTEQGFKLVAADRPSSFLEDSPTAKMVRQILGAVAEYQKDELVMKLAGARARMRAKHGKCEGRKSATELNPAMAKEAKRLYRVSPKTGKRRTLREIADELAGLGFLSATGKPIAPSVVARVVKG
ncbi:MAG: recombinase family protein [Rhodospirillaceae bacterium]